MPTTHATVTTFGPARFVAVRHVGPFQECGSAWQQLMQWVLADEIQFTATATFVLDNPMTTEPANIRKDVSALVSNDFQTDAEGFNVFDVPEIKVVTATLEGGYEGLPEAWGSLASEGLQSTGAHPNGEWTFEVYRNNPSTTPEEELRTDLYMSIS